MSFDPSRHWPSRPVSLLLTTAVHPSHDTARRAWTEWEALSVFEEADWKALRLFPTVARRLPALGAGGPLLPRLAGVRRFMWSKMQNRIRATRPHIAALVEAGIVPLLTKGAARLALDPGEAAERYSHDVDIVVPPAQWAASVDLLIARGLQPSEDWSRDRLVDGFRAAKHAVAMKQGEVDIDLHQSALLLNRAVHDDDAMRGRALPGAFAGVPVLAPSPADRLMMALCHGLLYDPARPGEWALDAVAALRAGDFDWAAFEAEVRARALSAFATAGLAYLKQVLGQDIPREVRQRLAADAGPAFAEELDSVFHAYQPRDAREAGARCIAEVERARRSAARLPPRDPAPLPATPWREAAALSAGTFALPLPAGADPRQDLRLEIVLPAPPEDGSFRCRLLTPEVLYFFTEMAAWEERAGGVVALRLPGPLLLLLDAGSVRLEIRGEGALPARLRHRWSSPSWDSDADPGAEEIPAAEADDAAPVAPAASPRSSPAPARRVPADPAVGDATAFEAFVVENMDGDAYLAAYPDVAATGADPIDHWLDHGFDEGRMLAPGLVLRRGEAARAARGDSWARFRWRGEEVAIGIRREEAPAAPGGAAADPEDAAFLAFVASVADPGAYLDAYPDVAAAGADPVLHWLEHGHREGRILAPDLALRFGPMAQAASGPAWRKFTWRRQPVAVSLEGDVEEEELMAQIRAQARHDPAVLAAGLRAIPNLRRFAAADIRARRSIDIPGLLDAIGVRPDAVLLVPRLVVGGAEKFAADLADALMANGRSHPLVIVTDQHAGEAAGWETLAILAPLRRARILFWRDHSHDRAADAGMLARLLNMLRPRDAVVINSRAGLDAVAASGLGLSRVMRISCAFFSMDIEGMGVTYGARFPRRTLPFATALTDNQPMAGRLRALHGTHPADAIVVLPPRVAPASEAIFAARLAARRRRAAGLRRSGRWAWVSRIEPWKGTAILAALARRRPQDRFDLYGPMQDSQRDLGLLLPNIRHHGTLPDVAAADFAEHDGFLFTSLFEGMPNVVLEMSQHAIPLVLAEVGGLRDTFGEAAAVFVRHGADHAATTAAFDAALDRVLAMTAEEAAAMAAAARREVMARHAPDAHARNVAALFGAA